MPVEDVQYAVQPCGSIPENVPRPLAHASCRQMGEAADQALQWLQQTTMGAENGVDGEAFVAGRPALGEIDRTFDCQADAVQIRRVSTRDSSSMMVSGEMHHC